MKKLIVMTVVGTRPEIIRLSRVMCALDDSPLIHHLVVHTGQNYDYELNEIFFTELGIRKPDYFLNSANSTPVSTIGQILLSIDPLLDKILPDALLVLGDTNSCLSALAAKKRKIPVFHMEAGNRSFDFRVPEETNRKLVDHLADINLTYSDIAREYLLREGLPADQIIKTGSPMFEVLNFYMARIKSSDILFQLKLEKYKYFLVSAHREENISEDISFSKFLNVLNSLAEIYNFPVIVSTHPRTRKKLENYKKASKSDIYINPLVQWLTPLGFFDYNFLQLNSFAVLSDSGTISEESSILRFPALNIRESHERPEAMEEASVMMVGFNEDKILVALSHLKSDNSLATISRNVNDYSVPNVSEKVVRIIISYTDYVKRVVWRQYNK